MGGLFFIFETGILCTLVHIVLGLISVIASVNLIVTEVGRATSRGSHFLTGALTILVEKGS